MYVRKVIFALLLLCSPSFIRSTCDQGCLSCSTDQDEKSECVVCDVYNFYTFNPATNQCDQNMIDNCEVPSYLNLCFLCSPGSILDTVSGVCVRVNPSQAILNCLRYDSNGNCSVCEQNYFVDDSKCTMVQEEDMIQNCETYSDSKTCLECMEGFFLETTEAVDDSTESTQTCSQIQTVSNCLTHSKTSCHECSSETYLNPNHFLNMEFNNEKLESFFQNSSSFFKKVSVKDFQVGICSSELYDENCTQIDDSTGECLMCGSDFYLSEGYCKSNPKPSIQDCLKYDNANTCRKCKSEMYFDGEKCVPVTKIARCVNYEQDSDSCEECSSNYFFDSGECKMRQNTLIENCLKLSNKNDQCEECDSNFDKSGDSLKCFEKIDNCNSPNENSGEYSCSICATDYYPIDDNSFCMRQNISNCDEYTDNTNTCTKCTDGYELNSQNNSCFELYVENCLTPDPTSIGECSNCEDNFYKNSSNKCLPYTVTNCTPKPDADECQQCNTNDDNDKLYYLFSDNRCYPYNLIGCDDPDPTKNECSGDCSDGFTKDTSDNLCKQIPVPNCNDYNFTTGICGGCTNQGTKFYLDANSNSCQQYSLKNCTTKSSTANECTSCVNTDDFYLLDGICIPYDLEGCDPTEKSSDSNTCNQDKCLDGFFMKSDNLCYRYTIDTTKCDSDTPSTNSNKCDSCKNGLILDSDTGECYSPWLFGCSDINDNGTDCDTCFNSFYKDSNQCYPYSSINCNTYSSSSDACDTDQCFDNDKYVLSTNSNHCIRVLNDNCISYSSGVCDGCRIGYTLNASDLCEIQVDEKCLLFDSTDHTQCKICRPDYFLDTSSGNICSKYTADLDFCLVKDPTSDGCSICQNGYFLNTTCEALTNKNCYAYDISTGDCTSCNAGFIFDSDNDNCDDEVTSFVVDENCLYSSEADGSCSKCRNNNDPTPVKSKVVQLENCLVGSTSNPECDQCENGYYLEVVGTTNKCTKQIGDFDCLRKTSGDNTQLNDTSACEEVVNNETHYLNSSVVTDRTLFDASCADFATDSQSCLTCKEGTIPLALTAKKHFCLEANSAFSYEANVTHAGCTGVLYNNDSTTLACNQICKTGYVLNGNAATDDLCYLIDSTIPNADSLKGIDLNYFTQAGSASYEDVSSPTPIDNCDKQIVSDDGTLKCAQCSSGYVGNITEDDNLSADLINNTFNIFTKEYQPQKASHLFEKCEILANTGFSTSTYANASNDLTLNKDTNIDALITISTNLILDDTKKVRIIIRCKHGFNPKVFKIVSFNWTELITFDVNSGFEYVLDCTNADSNLQKKYKNGKPTADDSEFPGRFFDTLVQYDSCADGKELVVFGNLLETGQTFYMKSQGDRDLEEDMYQCHSSYQSPKNNCQIHYKAADDTATTAFDPTSDALNGCLSCKPGYARATIAHDQDCTAIANCDISNDDKNTWMNACETCNDGFIWGYENDMIDYSKCVANSVTNCLIGDSSDTTVCKLCQKGYELVNGSCVSFYETYPTCSSAGLLDHSIKLDSDETFAANIGYFYMNYSNEERLYGCARCSGSDQVIFEVSSSDSICIKNNNPPSVIPNCKKYKYGSESDLECGECEFAYVLSPDEKFCFEEAEIYEGCTKTDLTNNVMSCLSCREGFSKRTVYINDETVGRCILNEYLIENTSNLHINLKKGFKLRTYNPDFTGIMPIPEDDECAQYLDNYCILCKDGSSLPYNYEGPVASDMMKFRCIKIKEATQYKYNVLKYDSGASKIILTATASSTPANIGSYTFLYQDSSITNQSCLTPILDDPKCLDMKLDGCEKCDDYYFLNSDKQCKRIKVDNCTKISSDMKCIQCSKNFYLNRTDDECIKRTKLNCADFALEQDICKLCPDKNYTNETGCHAYSVTNCENFEPYSDRCFKCNPGYYIGQDGNCESRSNLRCEEFMGDTETCLKCEEEFVLIGSFCMERVAENCKTVLKTLDGCATCEEGFFMDDTNNCQLRSNRLCKEFDRYNDECMSCPNGHFVDIENEGVCKEHSVMNCLEYNRNSDSCSSCKEGHYKNSTGCHLYTVNNCKSLNPVQDACLNCENGFFLSDNSCHTQNLNRCLMPNPYSNSCLMCESGHYINENGDCQQQSSPNCVEYMEFTNGCLSCADGFFINEDLECSPYTVTNCMNYSRESNKCLVCVDSFFKNSETGKCEAYLTMNCKEFHPFNDSCLVCNPGFYLKNDTKKCVEYDLTNCKMKNETSNECLICEENFYLSKNESDKLVCKRYTFDCVEGDRFDDKCSKCQINHHLTDKFECVPNDVNHCIEYLSNENVCIKCMNGYFLSSGMCSAYQSDNCFEYDPARDACKSCIKGMYLDNDSKLCRHYDEVENCSLYSQSSNTCVECDDYFYLENNKCLENPTGILHCVKYENANVCLKCEEDYFLQGNACNKINDTIENCKIYFEDGICSKCENKYFLSFENKCEEASNSTCLTNIDSNNCSTCEPTHYLKEETDGEGVVSVKCVESEKENCTNIEDSTENCLSCEDGYVLKAENCELPTVEIENCKKYETDTVCSRCEDNFVLNSDKSQCVANDNNLPNNCLTGQMQDTLVCSVCESGYRFNQNNECQKCGGDGCDICSPVGNSCRLCMKGFYMTTNNTCFPYPTIDSTELTKILSPDRNFVERKLTLALLMTFIMMIVVR